MTQSIVWIARLLVLAAASGTAMAQTHAVFKSVDGGQSWVRSDQGIAEGSRVNAFGASGETLFAGADTGVYLSTDEGKSWRPAAGVAATSGRVVSLATLGSTVFAGTDGGGLLTSPDGGETWTVSRTFPASKPRCLLAHQGSLYAGTDLEGVLVTRDGGATWTALGPGLPDHAQAFVLAAVRDKVFVGLYSRGLYAWNEHDGRWTKAGDVKPLVLAGIDDTLVAGHNPGGLFWSDDLGATWAKGAGRTEPQLLRDDAPLPSEAPVWELAANNELVVAGAAAGIYYSVDHGRTWRVASKGLPSESPGVSFLAAQDFVLAGVALNEANGASN